MTAEWNAAKMNAWNLRKLRRNAAAMKSLGRVAAVGVASRMQVDPRVDSLLRRISQAATAAASIAKIKSSRLQVRRPN